MDCRCRLGSLCTSSTASGNSDRGEGWPKLQLGLWDFFIWSLFYSNFHVHLSVLVIFLSSLCLISFLVFPCASIGDNASAWVTQFRQTEWNWLLSLCENNWKTLEMERYLIKNIIPWQNSLNEHSQASSFMLYYFWIHHDGCSKPYNVYHILSNKFMLGSLKALTRTRHGVIKNGKFRNLINSEMVPTVSRLRCNAPACDWIDQGHVFNYIHTQCVTRCRRVNVAGLICLKLNLINLHWPVSHSCNWHWPGFPVTGADQAFL